MRRKLREIFAAGLERVNPYAMIRKHVRIRDNALLIENEGRQTMVDLSDFRRILLLGADGPGV